MDGTKRLKAGSFSLLVSGFYLSTMFNASSEGNRHKVEPEGKGRKVFAFCDFSFSMRNFFFPKAFEFH